jgi:hypothetical protein
MKTCKSCGIEKEKSDYTGNRAMCKPCFNEYMTAKRTGTTFTSTLDYVPMRDKTSDKISCSSCNQEKDKSAFYEGRVKCRECCNEERRKKNKKNTETAHTIKKVCKHCNIEKTADMFVLSTLSCKACVSELNKESNNRPTEADPPKICRKCNVEQPAANFRHHEATCKQCNTKKLYEWRENNKEQFLGLCKKYRDSDKGKEVRKEMRNTKYRENVLFKLETLYRNRVRLCIKKKYFPKNTAYDYKGLLGCTWDVLCGWLEFNMKETMTWDNYGTFWHVDHVKPCSSFDFSKEEDRPKCFNWTNLMPLEGIENLKKSAKIDQSAIDHSKKRAIEFITEHYNMIETILTDVLPEDIRFLVTSGVLATKGDATKVPPGSGEISEVR